MRQRAGVQDHTMNNLQVESFSGKHPCRRRFKIPIDPRPAMVALGKRPRVRFTSALDDHFRSLQLITDPSLFNRILILARSY